ncbi:UDP-N-acetylmuramoyl-L-alanine--D-glutamate ligase [Oceanirhabdus sp. W0125-5]|uniref:UDP-N-acetylmuramoyl-L-alanine--D-glutamate ligase n=1 Tax=Oceanirhabdus sp. W0125-5 TaxID=2999116 RepID=UPI0022F2F20E|nr:UDP-N-acetylmuramoyl-L-alanine--D-glutamate ligase [Oceanirhabdus sp. W0125-5]WBW97955.1 UDP-N-acetylmuramoyl-L-alanine--D-glutamate ligase [Oceanirhabdus sp. W0125-5]
MAMNFKEFKENIKGKKVAVVGIGVSNIPLIKKLAEYGSKITAFDKKNHDDISVELLEEFNKLGINLCLGENYLEGLTGFDIVYRTPSMMPDNRYLVRCREEGAIITSEMEEFVKYCPAKIFAVTGSDGKTTTTSIIYEILKEEGYETWVGGNIGTPLFDKLDEMEKEHKVVLELSSFQLISMTQAIDVAVVTNLSPNHLDIHKDMDEYIDAKKNIFLYQTREDLLVINRENEITNAFEKESKGLVTKFSLNREIKNGAFYKDGKLYLGDQFVCNKEDIRLIGMHNVDNMLAAFCATKDDVSIESMNKVASSFSGVEHRIEFVREVDGVKYYNDSIASSPTRTIAGLRGFNRPVILIAGGYDKNIPFDTLAKEGFQYVKKLILVGLTKDKIRAEFEKEMSSRGKSIPIYEAKTFEETVEIAERISEYGDIVYLSPACASFDMFPNFMLRGEKFKELVNDMNR